MYNAIEFSRDFFFSLQREVVLLYADTWYWTFCTRVSTRLLKYWTKTGGGDYTLQHWICVICESRGDSVKGIICKHQIRRQEEARASSRARFLPPVFSSKYEISQLRAKATDVNAKRFSPPWRFDDCSPSSCVRNSLIGTRDFTCVREAGRFVFF